MAKRGRKPIAATVDDLPDALRGEVDEALRSDARESASSVFRRFGLAQRGLRIDTFIKYARKLREVCWTDEPPLDRETPSIELIRAKLLVRIYESAATGNVKPYELATLYARVQEHDRIEIQRAAEERAAEKHEQWKRVAQAAVRSELDKQEAAGKKDFSREDVADLVDKIMRGQT